MATRAHGEKELTLGTIQHVKHCLALLLRFLTLLLQNGAAKGRLQLIDHVRQEECGCAQTNSAVCRHPTGAHLNLNGDFSGGSVDLDHLGYVLVQIGLEITTLRV